MEYTASVLSTLDTLYTNDTIHYGIVFGSWSTSSIYGLSTCLFTPQNNNDNSCDKTLPMIQYEREKSHLSTQIPLGMDILGLFIIMNFENQAQEWSTSTYYRNI